MKKSNFNKAYMSIMGIFAIGIAISNIMSFFNGVGFALVGAGLLFSVALLNILKDEENKKRFGDIFTLITIELLLLIVIFFAYDFNLNGITKFPLIMRNICAIYSIFAEAYIIFRYISEIKGYRYQFVEYMLGNYIPEPKEKKEKKQKPSKEEIKKNKELENGTLAPKPSTVENFPSESTNEDSEDVESEDEVINETVEENEDSSKEQSENDESSSTNRTDYWN